jgi:hypothetical protein
VAGVSGVTAEPQGSAVAGGVRAGADGSARGGSVLRNMPATTTTATAATRNTEAAKPLGSSFASLLMIDAQYRRGAVTCPREGLGQWISVKQRLQRERVNKCATLLPIAFN